MCLGKQAFTLALGKPGRCSPLPPHASGAGSGAGGAGGERGFYRSWRGGRRASGWRGRRQRCEPERCTGGAGRGELPLLLPATGCALGVLCGGSDRRAGPVSLCGSAGSRAVARLPE